MRWRFLLPRFEWMRWGGDGMHGESGDLSWVEGRCFAVAWLGFHFEIVFALERAQ